MAEKRSKPRGRPRTFDREVALRTVMDVFWQYGYEGTSISKLLEATGLKATSLYAAFGDKESLFKEAVKLYIEIEGAYVWGDYSQELSTKELLKGMLKRAAKTLCHKDISRGCLLLIGDKGLNPENSHIKDFLSTVRDNLRSDLSAKIYQGIESGDLPKNTNVAASVSMIMIFLSGISLEVLDHGDEEALIVIQEAIDGFMQFWPVVSAG